MAWQMPTAAGQWTTAMGMSQDMNINQMGIGNYTPEQWAVLQQQNWQQWNQWQQQYSQWQTQYGEKYAQHLQTGQPFAGMPPLPVGGAAPPAPPPPEQPPPPPPPHENNQPLFGSNKSQPASTPVNRTPNFSNVQPTAGNNQLSYGTEPPKNAPSTPSNREALSKLEEEERSFDIQFKKWEEEIDRWRKENVNHPDKQSYKEYEDRFELCRAQLLERRQQMKLKRAQLMSNAPVATNPTSGNVPTPVPPPPPSNTQTNYNQSVPPPSSTNNSYQKDYNTQAPYSKSSNNEPQDTYSNMEENTSKDNYASTKSDPSTYLQTSTSSKSIPGLDLVPESSHIQSSQDIIDITAEDVTDMKQGPDYSNISKGINNILGDAKIMNILSMVQGNIPQANISQNIPPNASYTGNNQGFTPSQGNQIQNNFSHNQQQGNRQNMPYNRQGPKFLMQHDQGINSQFSQQQDIYDNEQDMQQNVYNDEDVPYRGAGNKGPDMRLDGPGMRQGSYDMRQGEIMGQGGPSIRHGGPDMRYGGPGGPGMHQGGPNMRPSGPNTIQAGPNMPPRGPNMRQGGPDFISAGDLRQTGPNIRQGLPDMRQGGLDIRHGSLDLRQGGPDIRQGGLDMRQGGPDMRQGGPDIRQGGPDMRQGGPDMRQGGPDMRQGGPDMRQGGSIMRQGVPPDMRQSAPGMRQPGSNMRQGGADMGHGGPNIQESDSVINPGGPSMQQNLLEDMRRPIYDNQPVQSSFEKASIPPLMGLNNRPPRQPITSQQNINDHYIPDQPIHSNNPVVNQPPRPKWVDEPLFAPTLVVDYEHKPLRLKARDFIAPVHTFDYNHRSKEQDIHRERDFEKEVEELFVRKPRRDEEGDRYVKDLYYRDYERRGPREDVRDLKDVRDMRDVRDSRDFRDMRDVRDMRDARDFRDREARDDIRDRIRDRPREVTREDIGRRRVNDRFDDRRRDVSHDEIRRDDRRDEIRRDNRRDERLDDRRDERWDDRREERWDDRREERRDDRDKFNRRDDFRERDRERENIYRSSSRDDKSITKREDNKIRGRSKEGDTRETEARKRALSKESDTSTGNKKAKESFTGAKKHVVMIDDLLESPGRDMRPEKIVIILRGLPGSGKSYLAKLIRDREAEHGGTARIMSIDDYFMQEGETEEKDPQTGKTVKKPFLKYEYDEGSEETYLTSLKRAFKRSLTDGYFSFLIFDAVNDQLKHYADIWNYARQNGFQVYICTMEQDLQTCFKRNVHNRKYEDLEIISARFFPTPSHHIQLDATTLLQSASITEVQMEDVEDDVIMEDVQEVEVESVFTSKWEKMDDATRLARLDGTSKPLRPSQLSMEDYLQLDDWKPNTAKPGKKTVRWADLEERREQEKMRAIGFVVGQTDWQRMTDPTMGSSALTQTKYIERVRRNY